MAVHRPQEVEWRGARRLQAGQVRSSALKSLGD